MVGKWVVVGAVNGLVAVGLGAMGAHLLKGRLEPPQLESFEVGVRYQMYHALALLAVAWLASVAPSTTANASAWCMLAGIILFCGSIYGLTLAGWRWLGPVTPIGGLLFMVGWLLLAIAAMRSAQPGVR